MVTELAPLLILGLATWRVASLLVNEAGPGDVFVKLRNLFGFTHDEHKHKVIIPDGFFGELFSCVWCCSLWVGLWWMGFYFLVPSFALRAATLFAISTLAILVQCITEK